MTSPAFTLPTEQEEAAELAALIGQLEQPTSDPEIDAVASDALRIMQQEQAEIDRYNAACKAELNRITDRYVMMAEAHVRRHDAAQHLVLECARRAQYVGKAKSRKVGNGTYGIRQKPEQVKIIDEKLLITWLRVESPDTIKQQTIEKVYQQDVKPVVLAALAKSGEVPPGIEHTEARDEPFAKALKEE